MDQNFFKSWGTPATSERESQRQLVEIDIEELVFQGFPDIDSALVAESVSSELTRLLLPASLPSLNREVSASEAAYEIAPDASAETAGVQIAQAIYGGMKR